MARRDRHEREFGPSAWDGDAAAVVSDAAIEALPGGQRVTVTSADQPALYSTR